MSCVYVTYEVTSVVFVLLVISRTVTAGGCKLYIVYIFIGYLISMKQVISSLFISLDD